MAEKKKRKETNADDLLRLLDECDSTTPATSKAAPGERALFDALNDSSESFDSAALEALSARAHTNPDDNSVPASAVEPSLPTDEGDASYEASEQSNAEQDEKAWTHHFNDNASPSSKPDRTISSHISDTAPDSVTSLSNAENEDADIEELDEKNDIPADTADEDEDKPIPVIILHSIASFFWNCGFIIKAVIYVLIVLILSAFMSYAVISVSNDVFAFIKSERQVTVEISENATRKQVAYLLEKNGVIEYSWAFNMYLIYRGDENGSFIPGEHVFSSSMNYNQIISELTEIKYEMTEVSVTIPEGYTVDQIIDLFLSNGIGTREGFVEAINKYPYRHEFVQMLDELGYPETRKYRLEGYLYPDTYYFYKDSPEYVIINKLLNNFNDRFWKYYETTFKADAEALNMTFDDVITLASMIQAEAKLYIDFEFISYVFHNRLQHSNEFPKLESDATVQYCLGERVEDLTYDQIHINNPYNTYICNGLPPGAICNPGFDAISAALYPDMPIDSEGSEINAYFFVSNKAGYTYYAATLQGHNNNKKQVALDNQYDENN